MRFLPGLALALLTLPAFAAGETITEYNGGFPGAEPREMTAGPDGTFWFCEHGANMIARITVAGVITEYPVPTPNANLDGITVGPDGNIWFAERGANKIGRLHLPVPTDGSAVVIDEFGASGQPGGLASGPDCALWFTELAGNMIGRITTSGAVTDYPLLTPAASPASIVTGPDGALWFTENTGSNIGRITTSGVVTEFAIPDGGTSQDIASGPDGNLWFTHTSGASVGEVGRITLAGGVTTFAILAPNSQPHGIDAGPDGALWFAELGADRIGRITTAGVVSDYLLPSPDSRPNGVAGGQGDSVWFTEANANRIGRLYGFLTRVTVPVAASIHGAGGSFFHSDVQVFNRSGTDSVAVTATYRCFAAPCGQAVQNFNLAPREMRSFNDMIAATFQAPESGGAIEFASTGNVVVTTRLYTPSRPSPTNGMGVPGVPEARATAVSVVTSLAHSADATKGFRSNVGAYNANDVAQTVTFTVYDGSGALLGHTAALAAARTSIQVSNIFGVIGVANDVADAYCVVSGNLGLPLLTYAGVIDNQSQDLTFIQGQTDLPLSAIRVTIPVAASIHGAGGSFFHTDATVLNASDCGPANVTVRYRCFSGSCGNSPQNFVLAPRQMRQLDDVIATFFGAPESGGAIEFDTDRPIVVNSRLYTPTRPAPTNGMGVAGLREQTFVRLVVTSLSHSVATTQGFRSNVGAYNASDVEQTITFTLFDPTGVMLGQTQAVAQPRTSVQVSNIFAAAGIAVDVPNAYCVVHGSLDLPLLVYAGVIDNQSQDLTFIQGVAN
jgi:streptogramin lyase